MTVSIDRAGRIVLPKPLRDQLNLHAGSQLEITQNGEGIELKPVETKDATVKVRGLWVHQGEMLDPQLDAVQIVNASREERINRLIDLVMSKKVS